MEISEIFTGENGSALAETVLAHINDNREPATPAYESLTEISEARLLYWIEYRALEMSARFGAGEPLVSQYQAAADILIDRGITPDSEGLGPWRFGVVTRNGVQNLRRP